MLPWGMHASTAELKDLQSHLHLNQSLWLIINTVFGIITLLCLNSLALEQEDIIGHDKDDMHMRRIHHLFHAAVEGYEDCRRKSKEKKSYGATLDDQSKTQKDAGKAYAVLDFKQLLDMEKGLCSTIVVQEEKERRQRKSA